MGNCRSKREASPDGKSNLKSDKCPQNGNGVDGHHHRNCTNESTISNTKIETNKLGCAPSRANRGNNMMMMNKSDTSEPGTSNQDVICSTRVEVNYLLLKIHEFQGTSETDKNYRYLDEMLTRCILNLDKIECNNTADRSNRKEAIRDVNQAIAILERKLAFNSDIEKLSNNLTELSE